MGWRREEEEYKDAEEKLQRKKLSEVCDHYGSSRQFIQVKEKCRCSICRENSDTKLLLVHNTEKLQFLGETGVSPKTF